MVQHLIPRQRASKNDRVGPWAGIVFIGSDWPKKKIWIFSGGINPSIPLIPVV